MGVTPSGGDLHIYTSEGGGRREWFTPPVYASLTTAAADQTSQRIGAPVYAGGSMYRLNAKTASTGDYVLLISGASQAAEPAVSTPVAESAQIGSNVRQMVISPFNGKLYLADKAFGGNVLRANPLGLDLEATLANFCNSDVGGIAFDPNNGDIYHIKGGVDVNRAPASLAAVTNVFGSTNNAYSMGVAWLVDRFIGGIDNFNQTKAGTITPAGGVASTPGGHVFTAGGVYNGLWYGLALAGAGAWRVVSMTGALVQTTIATLSGHALTAYNSGGGPGGNRFCASPTGVLFFAPFSSPGYVRWLNLTGPAGGEIAVRADADMSTPWYHPKTQRVYVGVANTLYVINPITCRIEKQITLDVGLYGGTPAINSVCGDDTYLYLYDATNRSIRKLKP